MLHVTEGQDNVLAVRCSFDKSSTMTSKADRVLCDTFVIRSATVCSAEPFLLTAGSWYLCKKAGL